MSGSAEVGARVSGPARFCDQCGATAGAPPLRLLLICTRKEQVNEVRNDGHFPREVHHVKLGGLVGNRPYFNLEDLAPEWAELFHPGGTYIVEIRPQQ